MRFLVSILFFLICFLQSAVSTAQEGFTGEQVKTAYLYNFLQFVEWPEGVVRADPVKIGVVGEVSDNFKQNLNKINGKKIDKSSVQVEYFADVSAVISSADSIALFYLFELSEADQLKIIGHVAEKPILTVGDQDSFIKNGGIISFINRENRILFDINLIQAEKNKFRIPSRLQRIANQVLR